VDSLEESLQADAVTYYNFADYSPSCSTFFQADLRTSPFTSSLLVSFDLECLSQSSCTLPYDYTSLPSPCMDEVLTRAFASEHMALYEDNYDPGNPNIDKFNRDTVPQFDKAVPEPMLTIVA
jgi:hypothetical protein